MKNVLDDLFLLLRMDVCDKKKIIELSKKNTLFWRWTFVKESSISYHSWGIHTIVCNVDSTTSNGCPRKNKDKILPKDSWIYINVNDSWVLSSDMNGGFYITILKTRDSPCNLVIQTLLFRKKSKTVPSPEMVVLALLWDVNGIIHKEFLSKDKTINLQIYSATLEIFK